MADYQIGDKVRLIRVPPYLYRDDPVGRGTAEFFERCLGKIFRVEDFDAQGQLELWTTGKGNQRRSSGRNSHWIWIEPELRRAISEAPTTAGLTVTGIERHDTRGAKMKSRIMYIERKAGRLIGSARIGRVTFSKTGRTIYYQGKSFQSLNGAGFKSNYCELESGEDYWISGCHKDGSDRLYGERVPIEIDEDVREEYWVGIRRQPEKKGQKAR